MQSNHMSEAEEQQARAWHAVEMTREKCAELIYGDGSEIEIQVARAAVRIIEELYIENYGKLKY